MLTHSPLFLESLKKKKRTRTESSDNNNRKRIFQFSRQPGPFIPMHLFSPCPQENVFLCGHYCYCYWVTSVMCVWPHPWDSPGKNTGVGCHFLLQCIKVKSESEVSSVRLLATPWTTAYQAPPSMGFSRQEYWSGVPLPSLPEPKFWADFIIARSTFPACCVIFHPVQVAGLMGQWSGWTF